MTMIKTPSDFGRALRSGPYAWPGGYPTYFATDDGAALCHECARAEGKQVTAAIRDGARDGWRVVAQEINYEDAGLYCDNCSERIESAYAEDEAMAVRAGRRQI
jgi:recombinational DNA repair protein (RecF pathway)